MELALGIRAFVHLGDRLAKQQRMTRSTEMVASDLHWKASYFGVFFDISFLIQDHILKRLGFWFPKAFFQAFYNNSGRQYFPNKAGRN